MRQKCLRSLGQCSMLVCLMIASAWAVESSKGLEELVAKVQQAYERIPALTADFVQIATYVSINRQQTSSGRLYIEKPHLIRWEYTQPEAQTILYDGKVLRVYLPRRRQVLQSPLPATDRTNVALLFLAGIGKLQEVFRITPVAKREAHLVYLRLQPRSPQAGFTELQIAVNPQNYLVEKLIIRDTIGNLTEIRLLSLQVHPRLPAQVFALSLPPDTEILTPADMRGQR